MRLEKWKINGIKGVARWGGKREALSVTWKVICKNTR